ncbi:hypothetical protein [Actinomadura sp. 9N407]|uniref:hypothetical protein n=1 Tax=Actinomadura sp. 9N407 TaxID=3375154 RepID=UPI0037ACFE0A
MTLDLEETGYHPGREPPGRPDIHADAPQLIPRGRFAIDPEPFGPPFVPVPESDRLITSNGPRRTIVVNVDDLIALAPHPKREHMGGCCGFDPHYGPNLICEACGQEIATEANDCGMLWHWVRLFPDVVLGAPPAPPPAPGTVHRRHNKRRRDR